MRFQGPSGAADRAPQRHVAALDHDEGRRRFRRCDLGGGHSRGDRGSRAIRGFSPGGVTFSGSESQRTTPSAKPSMSVSTGLGHSRHSSNRCQPSPPPSAEHSRFARPRHRKLWAREARVLRTGRGRRSRALRAGWFRESRECSRPWIFADPKSSSRLLKNSSR